MTTRNEAATQSDRLPDELVCLRDRISLLPDHLRTELEPLADRAIEEAVFRGRVLNVAKEALERFRMDLNLTRFDLEATRREREALAVRLGR